MSTEKKAKKTSAALVVLTDPQIGSHYQFDRAKATEVVKREVLLIREAEGNTALRALRLGVALYCIKETLGHGNFMPFVKKSFGAGHKTATDYMRLARYFVEKTSAQSPDVLMLAQTNESLALGDARCAKAKKFIGEKTLTELIAEAVNAQATGDSKKTKPATPDAEQLYLFARDEIGSVLTQAETLLVKENRLQHLAHHPEEVRGVVVSLRDLADRVEKAAKSFLKK